MSHAKSPAHSSAIERLYDAHIKVESPSTLKDAWLIFFKFWSPRIMAVYAAIAVTLRLVAGGWSWWDLAVVAAILAIWPIQEWLIHVFILHFKPRTIFGKKIDLLVAQKHRMHHGDPWNLPLVFIPLHIHPFAPFIQGTFWFLAMPTTPLALTGIAAYFVFSLHYEWVHYIVHTRYRPKSWFYGRLWRNHRLHHFMNEHYWYGVTMLSGDKVLRTAPDRKTVEPSPTCRTLGGMEDLGAKS
jgi:hypothetical protein